MSGQKAHSTRLRATQFLKKKQTIVGRCDVAGKVKSEKTEWVDEVVGVVAGVGQDGHHRTDMVLNSEQNARV